MIFAANNKVSIFFFYLAEGRKSNEEASEFGDNNQSPSSQSVSSQQNVC